MENQTFIRNDNSPELKPDGLPTNLQLAKEYSNLFWHILKGYGVPFQLIKFLYKIYEIGKPGKIYYINDYRMAENLGIHEGSGRNYVVALRKGLKEWINGSYPGGVRHYHFVSITDAERQTKTTAAVPTGYEISQEFQNVVLSIWKKVHESARYRIDKNWILAIKEVCEQNKGELLDFGYINYRPQKRFRSADDIFGTLLLNYRRLTKKIILYSAELGFDPEETKGKLKEFLDFNINDCYGFLDHLIAHKPGFSVPEKCLDENGAEIIGAQKKVLINAKPGEFQTFWDRAINYVADKEETPETLFPQAWQGGKKQNDVWSNVRQLANHENGGAIDWDESLYWLDQSRKSIRHLCGKQSETTLDRERERFLERRKEPPGTNGAN